MRFLVAITNQQSLQGLGLDWRAFFAGPAPLTRMLAAETADNGLKIRVNSIAPGVFPSEMTTDGSDDSGQSHIPREKYQDKLPAGRPGRDVDMAQAAVSLVVNQYINGLTLALYGGYTLAAGL